MLILFCVAVYFSLIIYPWTKQKWQKKMIKVFSSTNTAGFKTPKLLQTQESEEVKDLLFLVKWKNGDATPLNPN